MGHDASKQHSTKDNCHLYSTLPIVIITQLVHFKNICRSEYLTYSVNTCRNIFIKTYLSSHPLSYHRLLSFFLKKRPSVLNRFLSIKVSWSTIFHSHLPYMNHTWHEMWPHLPLDKPIRRMTPDLHFVYTSLGTTLPTARPRFD